MALTQLAPPYPIFTDKSGSPLDAGYLYFGEINKNPETNPIQVYYDSDMTQPAAQPLRTSNGYVMRNGSPAVLYADVLFSVTVRDKNGALVIYSPAGYGIDMSSDAAAWAEVAKRWAVNPEDVPVEPNKYSALNYAAKAQGYANVAGAAAGFFDRETVADLVADTTFTYTPGSDESVSAGDIIRTRAEGFAYEVAASGATDEHLSTAGGIKLYVQEAVGGYNVKAFNAFGDGVTDDADAIEAAVNAALSGGRSVYFPPGDYVVNTPKSFTYIGDLKLIGDEANLLLTYTGGPVVMGFGAQSAATTTLSADVNDEEWSVTVADATGMSIGQLIHLSTNTQVTSLYAFYTKRSLFLISGISGNTIYLSDPLNFGFTVAETTVTTFEAASIHIDGLNIKQSGSSDKRFDTTRLQNVVFENSTIEAIANYTGDVWFIGGCYNVVGRKLNLIKGRYTINASDASRNLYFEDIFAKDCRHPIDCNIWTFNTRIVRQYSVNTQNGLQCHPCFEVHYEDCTDFVEPLSAANIGLRCAGGSIKNCTVSGANALVSAGVGGAYFLAAYDYLGQKYDRVYEGVVSDKAILSAFDVRTMFVRNCDVAGIFVDGQSFGVTNVLVDKDTVSATRMGLRRIQVLNDEDEHYIAAPPDTFASVNTIKDITGITQANPAVVTALAHGYSNGDLIRIDGVVGMTEVNSRTFTIDNVTTDTFELAGEDSTGYTAYSAGGKATLGRLAKTVDPQLSPGLGWEPKFKARALVRETTATLSPGTSVTIPVKIVNAYDIQEQAFRHTTIELRVYSKTDGAVINKYQATFFLGSTSGSTLSAVEAEVQPISTVTAAIANFRHHYYTQVAAEGGDPNADANIGEYYYSFDLVVTCNSTSDQVNHVEVAVDERRTS